MCSEIPVGEDCIVMQVLGDDKYSVWWFNHGDPKVLTVTSAAAVGECVTNTGRGLVVNARRSKGLAMIHNRSTPLVKMKTTVVVPLPAYFEDRAGANIPSVFRKHVAIAKDVGVIACVAQLFEQMEPGVPYELYAITPPDALNKGILKVMQNIQTYWLGSKQTAKEVPYTRVFAAQMISKHGVYMKIGQEQPVGSATQFDPQDHGHNKTDQQHDVEFEGQLESACQLDSHQETHCETSASQHEELSEQHEICAEETRRPKEDFESAEGKKMTSIILQKLLNNSRVFDALREAGAAATLTTLQYTVSSSYL